SGTALGYGARRSPPSARSRSTRDRPETRRQASGTGNRMPLANPFVRATQGIWRPNRGIAVQLAKAICAWRFKANQDWRPIDDFECARDLNVPIIGAQRSLSHYHSGLLGVWNRQARYDGNVASFFGATDSRLETRLVARGSWDRYRNPCSGGETLRWPPRCRRR